MGREVRRVPLDWQHPKRENGYFIPLHDDSYALLATLWDEGAALWEQGFIERDGSLYPRPTDISSYEEFDGERPVESEYFPEWPTAERIGWQLYETVTEGTPLSPVCRSDRDLACWLTWFGYDDHSYEEWLEIIKSDQAIPSFYLEVPWGSSLTASSGCDGPPIIYDSLSHGPRIPLFDEILSVFGMGGEGFLVPGMSAQRGSVIPETHNPPCSVPVDHCRHHIFRFMTGKDSASVVPETHRMPRLQSPWAMARLALAEHLLNQAPIAPPWL